MNKPIINPPTGPSPAAMKKLAAFMAKRILIYEAAERKKESAS